MIDSVKPVSKTEYTAGTKSVRDATVEGQQEGEASYVVDIGSASGTESAGGKKLSADQLAAIKQQVDAQNASLRNLVEKLLGKQGNTYKTAFDEIKFDSDMTPGEAQAAIAEDGYWGVNAVSDRIVAFAKAVSGSDPTKIAELKAAIDKGFELAGKSFGGGLPDICNQTHDAIMKKLDDWAQSGGVDVEA
jgi:hypothetical protein